MIPSKKQNWLPAIFNDFLGNEWVAKANSSSPAINIIENNSEYRIEIAAPGICKDNFKIHITEDNHLVVSMQKKNCSNNSEPERDPSERYLRHEFSFAQFQQTLILPDNIDRDNICAEQLNGVLTIVVPKREGDTPTDAKEINIK